MYAGSGYYVALNSNLQGGNMDLGMYRYVVVTPTPPSGKWDIPELPTDTPSFCFGFFQTMEAAAAHMRYLGGRFPCVSVWDRASYRYVAHLYQEQGAIQFDPIWPLLSALVLQPNGTYREVKYAQNHDGSLTEKG